MSDPEPKRLRLSVVVPVFDEVDSLVPLHRELDAALAPLSEEIELIFVDDGSRDGSGSVLRDLERKDARVRVESFPENRGQSAALDAGFRLARGEWIATLDADLQNDPADLPRLLDHCDRADLVNGVRVDRRDTPLRIWSSRIANAIRNWATGESVTDVGCSLRVMRASTVQRIKLYRGLHRFLPTLLKLEGARCVEVPVSHRPRRYGRSKYGIRNRLVPALVDLLAVRWMQRRALPPRPPSPAGRSSDEPPSPPRA
ncbi:MAG: glycosyltransferase family 2 protein [Myxococcota bacterium]